MYFTQMYNFMILYYDISRFCRKIKWRWSATYIQQTTEEEDAFFFYANRLDRAPPVA